MMRSSQVMYGSHSAPLTTRISALPFTFSFAAVGKPAPPMPTMPASSMRARTLSGVISESGGSETLSSVPSLSMRIWSTFFPPPAICPTTPLTTPATGE